VNLPQGLLWVESLCSLRQQLRTRSGNSKGQASGVGGAGVTTNVAGGWGGIGGTSGTGAAVASTSMVQAGADESAQRGSAMAAAVAASGRGVSRSCSVAESADMDGCDAFHSAEDTEAGNSPSAAPDHHDVVLRPNEDLGSTNGAVSGGDGGINDANGVMSSADGSYVSSMPLFMPSPAESDTPSLGESESDSGDEALLWDEAAEAAGEAAHWNSEWNNEWLSEEEDDPWAPHYVDNMMKSTRGRD
jgi:hypothetical protein